MPNWKKNDFVEISRDHGRDTPAGRAGIVDGIESGQVFMRVWYEPNSCERTTEHLVVTVPPDYLMECVRCPHPYRPGSQAARPTTTATLSTIYSVIAAGSGERFNVVVTVYPQMVDGSGLMQAMRQTYETDTGLPVVMGDHGSRIGFEIRRGNDLILAFQDPDVPPRMG